MSGIQIRLKFSDPPAEQHGMVSNNEIWAFANSEAQQSMWSGRTSLSNWLNLCSSMTWQFISHYPSYRNFSYICQFDWLKHHWLFGGISLPGLLRIFFMWIYFSMVGPLMWWASFVSHVSSYFHLNFWFSCLAIL